MHLLPVTTVTLDEGGEAVDLGQPPGDVAVLSFADSDLEALAAARDGAPEGFPSLRLASLRRLRHPLSVDLYVEATAARSRFVLVRCLGGVDYWRYGLETLLRACGKAGVPLAVLPGDDRPDPRLPDYATVPAYECEALEGYFRSGGVDNMRRLMARIGAAIGMEVGPVEEPRAVPRGFLWTRDGGVQAAGRVVPPPAELGEGDHAQRGGGGGLARSFAVNPLDSSAASRPARPLHQTSFGPPPPLVAGEEHPPLAHILVYRSMILAGDTALPEALAEALKRRGIEPAILAVSSLKDPDAAAVVEAAIAARCPDVILAATAFASRDDDGFVLDRAGCPVIQVSPVGSTRDAWAASPRGLSATDLAMLAALPEFDGRIAGGPVAFKEEAAPDPAIAAPRRRLAPDPEGTAYAADLAAAWVRLARTPRAERRLALVMSDYPARGGRAGFAVGLDTPKSACAILARLSAEGFCATPGLDPAELMRRLTEGAPGLHVGLDAYRAWLAALPQTLAEAVEAAWGGPEEDPALVGDAFAFRAVRAGNVLVALQPDRGRGGDRKARYHDPDLPPSHAYLAFHLSLRHAERVDALIHLGTHGTAEWLPGKAVALSGSCWPRAVIGALPVIYPFIVDDPGEAAPAKRRIGAVTLGHLTPAVMETGLHGEAASLRELVEEFSAAQVLDPRRAAMVAQEILARARRAGIAEACGVDEATPMDEALARLDAHLCDLGEVVARNGLHVFGEGRPGLEACGEGEWAGLLAALDGRFVRPGPAGSPSRGRLDVIPTGRNLSTLDPRAIPTRTAAELGRKAADEVVRRHLQDHGDWPKKIVMDLWASPTLRTAGEDIAHALALMGAKPLWDPASTRVTGFEIVPHPLLDRPRADVTVRVSGAFRDTFPDQIALIDQAARAIAALDEDDEWNALAASRRRGESLARVFGGAPGTYGAGVSRLALDGDWEAREDLGRTYLAGVTHALGRGGEARADGSFCERVAGAEAFVHATDVAERDILDGDAVADSLGGFAAAAETLGNAPALYSLDTSRPERPRARTLAEDVDRLVRGRLSHPRWIEGQLRHGFRGAAEIAQGVDALFAFAATTRAVGDAAFDVVFAAVLGNDAVRERIREANPAALEAIRSRLADARDRGLWTTRSNSVAALLDGALREAAE